MTFAEYWAKLQDRNPGLKDEAVKMTLPVAGFKRALEQAYSEGALQQSQAGRKLDDLIRRFGK